MDECIFCFTHGEQTECPKCAVEDKEKEYLKLMQALEVVFEAFKLLMKD